MTESSSTPSLLSTLEQAQSPSILVSPTTIPSAPPSPFALTTSPPRLSSHSTAVSRSPSTTRRSPASPSRARSHSPAGLPLAPGTAFASRPSPVVPSPGSGSVVGGLGGGGAGLSPSRPVSPGPRMGLMTSPERERRQSGGAMLEPYDHNDQSGVDLNHIFERGKLRG